MSLDALIQNQVQRGFDGNHEPRIGEIHYAPKPVPGRDIPANGSSYLRSAYPAVEADYPSPGPKPNFATKSANTGATNSLPQYGVMAACSGAIVMAFGIANGSSTDRFIRSTDGGATWSAPAVAGLTNVSSSYQPQDLVFGGANGQTLLAALGVGTSTSSVQVVRSTDYGTNWTATSITSLNLNNGSGVSARRSTIPAPTQVKLAWGNGIWMLMIKGSAQTYHWDCWTSSDDGLNWTKVGTLALSSGNTASAYPRLVGADGRWLFVVNQTGTGAVHLIYRSLNNGVTWESLNNFSCVTGVPAHEPQDFIPFGTSGKFLFVYPAASGNFTWTSVSSVGGTLSVLSNMTGMLNGFMSPRVFKLPSQDIVALGAGADNVFSRARFIYGQGSYTDADNPYIVDTNGPIYTIVGVRYDNTSGRGAIIGNKIYHVSNTNVFSEWDVSSNDVYFVAPSVTSYPVLTTINPTSTGYDAVPMAAYLRAN